MFWPLGIVSGEGKVRCRRCEAATRHRAGRQVGLWGRTSGTTLPQAVAASSSKPQLRTDPPFRQRWHLLLSFKVRRGIEVFTPFLAFSCSFDVGEKSMMKCQAGRWVSVYSTYVRPQRLLHSGTLVTCSLAPLAGNEKVYRKWTFFPKNVYSFLFSISLTNTRSFDVVYLGDVCWVHTSPSHPCVCRVMWNDPKLGIVINDMT